MAKAIIGHWVVLSRRWWQAPPILDFAGLSSQMLLFVLAPVVVVVAVVIGSL